jgi:hypothetical protein
VGWAPNVDLIDGLEETVTFGCSERPDGEPQ